jgi:hypothetical protein
LEKNIEALNIERFWTEIENCESKIEDFKVEVNEVFKLMLIIRQNTAMKAIPR